MTPGWDDELPPLRDVRIPDDARELDPDRQAWLREQRRRGFAARDARLGAPDARGDRSGWPSRLGLLAPMFAVMVALSLLLALTTGSGQPGSPSAPLANPSAPDGSVGGLLPDVLLAGPVGPVASRSLRPAVLVLLPSGCACQAVVTAVTAAAARHRLRVWLLVDTVDLPAARMLATGAGAAAGVPAGHVSVLSGAVAPFQRDYRMSGVTLVLVRADGIVTRTLRAVTAATPVAAELDGLAAATGPGGP